MQRRREKGSHKREGERGRGRGRYEVIAESREAFSGNVDYPVHRRIGISVTDAKLNSALKMLIFSSRVIKVISRC